MSGQILCTRRDSIATVTLDHPEKRNALDLSMWQSLATTLRTLAADSSLRCVVVRGAGDEAFAAGGDIEEFLHARDTLERAQSYHAAVGAALRAIADCPHPTLAAIRGACIGGGLEIASQCDLRLCGDSARFGVPINRLGFSMYPEEMQGVLAIAGPATTLELLLEGRILTAAEALARGLVTRVVPDAQLTAEVDATTQRIAAGAPLVARWHKQWVRRLQQPAPLSADELRQSFAFLDTADYQEGLHAFLEKRKPEFRGC
ncbi:enoyl-CoA hydratase/isomerase family protein [Rhodocyclus tenuis]|uniref:Enoyl-CoA hydratase/isomerase family protein n=2 Tax=Rhodocyclus TaxID=1064 RepID=A0A6L5JXV6_RHOTE|nr:enoyl-CoA hydratase-related protein [Rhodocyclus gracilis]MQY51420.1 enoyl-CoA hydratase/isomerase family protein [Rhodocyclus gracilis]NJA89268.1 enoyl-CoA hydratase/isomerase family protein [Rhodocyclus gracilis]